MSLTHDGERCLDSASSKRTQECAQSSDESPFLDAAKLSSAWRVVRTQEWTNIIHISLQHLPFFSFLPFLPHYKQL